MRPNSKTEIKKKVAWDENGARGLLDAGDMEADLEPPAISRGGFGLHIMASLGAGLFRKIIKMLQ